MGRGGEDVAPSMCGIKGSIAGYQWASETVTSLARRFGSGPPGRRGSDRGEDIISPCAVLEVQRLRSEPVGLAVT